MATLPSAARSGLVALLVVVACTATSQAARTPREKRPAPKPPVSKGVAVYDRALFGPERPLADLVARWGLAVEDGKLVGARVLVLKHQRRLELWVGERMVKAYRVQLGPRPVGPKVKVKDGRTPEGDFRICALQGGKYHRGLLLDYPSVADAARGLESGLISQAQHDAIVEAQAAGRCPPQNTRLGGYILVHGQDPMLTTWLVRAERRGAVERKPGALPGDGDPANLDRVQDWTQGCVALLNPDIRELHRYLPVGTPVAIRASGEATRPKAPPARG